MEGELLLSWVRRHYHKPIGVAVLIRGGIVDVVFSSSILIEDRKTRVLGMSFGVVLVPGLAEAIANQEELDTVRELVKSYIDKDLRGVHRRVAKVQHE